MKRALLALAATCALAAPLAANAYTTIGVNVGGYGYAPPAAAYYPPAPCTYYNPCYSAPPPPVYYQPAPTAYYPAYDAAPAALLGFGLGVAVGGGWNDGWHGDHGGHGGGNWHGGGGGHHH